MLQSLDFVNYIYHENVLKHMNATSGRILHYCVKHMYYVGQQSSTLMKLLQF